MWGGCWLAWSASWALKWSCLPLSPVVSGCFLHVGGAGSDMEHEVCGTKYAYNSNNNNNYYYYYTTTTTTTSSTIATSLWYSACSVPYAICGRGHAVCVIGYAA